MCKVLFAILLMSMCSWSARPQSTNEQTGATEAERQFNSALSKLEGRSDTKFVQSNVVLQKGIQDFATRQAQESKLLGFTSTALSDIASPWEMFAYQLDQQIRQGADWSGIQMVGVPLNADWNDPTLGKWRQWALFGDSMSPWGPAYRQTQLQASKGYEVFIENIDVPLPNPQDKAKAEKARNDYLQQLKVLETAQSRVGDHWTDFDRKQSSLPPNRRVSFDQWYKQFDGARIAQLQSNVDLAAQTYTHWLILAYGGYGWVANLLTDYNNQAFQGFAQNPSGTTLAYRMYDIDPDLDKFIQTSKTGTGHALSFSFQHDDHRQHLDQTAWSGGASYSYGFFSFGASASGGSLNIDTHDANFLMTFSASNVGTFTVKPHGWFNATAVKGFKNGPWIPNGPIAKGTMSLWGPDGVFNLMTTQLIVVYHPKIVARLSKSDYQYAESHFQASGGMSIGPFGFGGSYSRRNEDVHFDSTTNTITAEDTSDTPQVIAVIVGVLPNYK